VSTEKLTRVEVESNRPCLCIVILAHYIILNTNAPPFAQYNFRWPFSKAGLTSLALVGLVVTLGSIHSFASRPAVDAGDKGIR